MIPNFTLDSTVTRHLEAWAASGEKEWQPNGTRIVEWNAKKEYVPLAEIVIVLFFFLTYSNVYFLLLAWQEMEERLRHESG